MNNKIVLVKKDGTKQLLNSITGMSLNFSGTNNSITVHEGTKFSQCIMNLVSNMNIEIGRSKFGIVKLKIYGNDSDVSIGDNFSCWGLEIRCHEERTSVTIGNDCMFSEEILIYPTDVHTILDQFTGEILNFGKPITIGNHVWCGRGVTFLKGSTVLNDSILASHSLVNSVFNRSNIIIGGSPAKIIKQGINWARETPYQTHQKQRFRDSK